MRLAGKAWKFKKAKEAVDAEEERTDWHSKVSKAIKRHGALQRMFKYTGKEDEEIEDSTEDLFHILSEFMAKPAKEIETGPITKSCKQILSKEVRSEGELEEVEKLLRKHTFFNQFDPSVVRALCKVIVYTSFGKGKILLKEGHAAESVFFILAGVVSVSISGTNPITGKVSEDEMTEITEGEHFGHISLLYDIKREATYRSKLPVQLLSIYRDDFDEIMRQPLAAQVEIRRRLFKELPSLYEAVCTEAELNALSAFSKSVHFEKETVITGGIDDLPKHVYFVTSGECKYVRAVEYTIECPSPNERKFVPVPPSVNRDPDGTINGKKIHKQLLEVCTLRYGSYFGVGEDLSETYIIALDNCTCLLIPRGCMIKYGMRSYLDRLCRIQNDLFPTQKRLLELYLEHRKWLLYKKNIAERVLRNVKVTSDNVPVKPHTKPFVKYF